MSEIDEYGRNVYLPEHIKKIKIDTSDIDSFMEKIQKFSDLDQTWLIKKLVVEIEDKQIEINKYTEERNKFWLGFIENIKKVEKDYPNETFKDMKQTIMKLLKKA